MFKRFAALLVLLTLVTSALADPSMSYRRLLPLEGGSNFRDMGGYITTDGQRVRRGLLFRSAAMAALTAQDMLYLDEFGFKTVVDLRTKEEIQLFPNHWAESRGVHYITNDYSFTTMMKGAADEERKAPDMATVYPRLLTSIAPQMKQYFSAALRDETPMVVNCSAGQDRTGVTAAIMLTLLGVPKQVVVEDYLLSTDFRRPDIENSGVDLQQAAKTNAFAAMMLQYQKAMPNASRPNPLVTAEGLPYLQYVFDQITKDYGTVEVFASKVLGLSAGDITKLRTIYLDS